MNHFSRLILRLMMNRIRGRILQEITPEQYGFMPDKETEHQLHLMGIVVQEREQTGLFINIVKSYTMVFSKSSCISTCQIKVNGKPRKHMNSFIYPGSVFTFDGRCEKGVNRHIGIAKTAFTSMKKVLRRNISMPVRLRILIYMLYLVNSAIRMDIEQSDDEKLGGSRTLVSKKNLRIP